MRIPDVVLMTDSHRKIVESIRRVPLEMGVALAAVLNVTQTMR
jgi:hypothetical protein